MLDEKTLLTIGMLSERSGVAHSALRFYETKKLIASIRTSGNQRRYHPSMLRRIALIQVAQLIGFTLEDIAKELGDLPMKKTATKRDWEKVASKWQKDLDAKLHQIQLLKDNLTGCIGCGCLSMEKCQLLNPDDILHEEGCGAQRINLE
jgi:MerR family redox-sensitive transcriptional activator SoxR